MKINFLATGEHSGHNPEAFKTVCVNFWVIFDLGTTFHEKEVFSPGPFLMVSTFKLLSYNFAGAGSV